MYRSIIIVVLALVQICHVVGQSVEEEVNRDVWLPFIDAYNTLDADAFMAVHTNDVIRINRDGKSIRVGAKYAEVIGQNYERDKKLGRAKEIDLRFLERFYSDSTGYEVGIYRVRRTQTGQEQLFYGKFHVILRKVGDRWKIAVDSDISNDGMITEEAFMAASPIPRG